MPHHILFFLLPFIIASFLLPCTPYVDPFYQYCKDHTITKCGDIDIPYPPRFAGSDYACGYPYSSHFHCDDNNPLFTINHRNYKILSVSDDRRTCTIVSEKVLDKNCDPSDYSDLNLREPSPDIHIASEYEMNITLWWCDTVVSNKSNFFFGQLNGNSMWYYSFNNTSLPPSLSCESRVEVPVKVGSTFEEIPPNFLEEGFQIQWQENESFSRSCDSCEKSWGLCGYNFSDFEFVCSCQDGIHAKDSGDAHVLGGGNKSKPTGAIIGTGIGGAFLIIVAAILLAIYKRKKKMLPQIQLCLGKEPVNPKCNISKVEKFLEDFAYKMPIRYSYPELKKMTNNFSDKLGEGGFGVVYKGKLPNGTVVAAKLLDQSRHSEMQFMNEVGTIGRIHHVHLVRLLGFCFEEFRSALIYEYMANGSLERFIFKGSREHRERSHSQDLSWEQLYAIALGAARGIAYLHHDCDKRIIHFDIKPHNILLDEEMSAKVSDFGLAKLCGKGDDHISMTGARGTPGYVAPEVWSRNFGPITEKSDVYSFGMLLLEIVGGRENIDLKASHSSQLYFPEWAFHLLERRELSRLRGGAIEAEEELKAMKLCNVGMWCIQHKSTDRPSMGRVVQMLEGNGDDIPRPPMPFNSSTAPEAPLLATTEESSSMN